MTDEEAEEMIMSADGDGNGEVKFESYRNNIDQTVFLPLRQKIISIIFLISILD